MTLIEELFPSLDLGGVSELVRSISGDACVPDLETVTFTDGYALIRIRLFITGRTWLLRIPRVQPDSILDQVAVRPLEYFEKNLPSIPAPRVYSYATDGENLTGVAYILVDWIAGTPLEIWTPNSPAAPTRQCILEQLAEHMLDMILAPATGDILYALPDEAPKGVPCSTLDWLTFSVDRGVRRALNRKDVRLAIDYLIQRTMVPNYVVPEVNDAPWSFSHPDLHNGNIITDGRGTIKGFIDWDIAFGVPLQKAATYPKLLHNVPGAILPNVPEHLASFDFAQDKEFFLQAVKASESRRCPNKEPVIAGLMRGSEERNFFELSLHSPTIRPEYIERHCPRSRDNLMASLQALEDFQSLKRNSSWRECEGLQDVRARLKELLTDA